MVSRIAIDLRNLGVVAGDYLVDGSEGYARFCAASLVGRRTDFSRRFAWSAKNLIDGISVASWSR
jgi:hypothetical protein